MLVLIFCTRCSGDTCFARFAEMFSILSGERNRPTPPIKQKSGLPGVDDPQRSCSPALKASFRRRKGDSFTDRSNVFFVSRSCEASLSCDSSLLFIVAVSAS